MSPEILADMLEKNTTEGQLVRQDLLKRMGNLSTCIKTLKLRFSIYYNQKYDRFGTLWAGNFKSTLIEGDSFTLSTVAAYIDLNPVRAGLVKDPKDYRFCGYAEALSGSKQAREGIALAIRGQSFTEILQHYRVVLFLKGSTAAPGKENAAIIDPEAARKVTEAEGELPNRECIRHRFRYFTDGAVLGSEGFVQGLIKRWKICSGRKTVPKSRPILEDKAGEIYSLKGLRQKSN